MQQAGNMYQGATTSYMLDEIRKEVARRFQVNPVCALESCGKSIDKPEQAALVKGGRIVHIDSCYVRTIVEQNPMLASNGASSELAAVG